MASRKDQKEQRRAEREAAEQAAAKKQQRQRTYGIVAGGILIVGVIVAVIAIAAGGGSDDKSTAKGSDSYGPAAKFAAAATPPAKGEEDLFKAAKTAGCVLKNPPIEGSTHVSSKKALKFGTNPPTSGDHDANAQPDGVYTQYPQPRHFVHSMEGGRVLIQYNPKKVDKQDIAKLGGIYNADNLYLAIFPNPTMPYAVAVTSWGHLAGCKKVTDATYDVVRDFIDRYRDQSPEPAATHQPAVNGQGWPDGFSPVPPPHKNGGTAGS